MPQKETAKQQGKPCLEELTSLTVSQIISQEAEDVLPSPQVPSEKTAQTSLYGRDVAEITEVTTVSNVDELIEIQKPEIQKGKPNLEELLSLSVTQTVFNETEALLPSPEMPRETMAQTDISGRDVAETSQILTMLSVEELAKQLTPDKRAGQFKIEELSSLTVSQVLSHETEETFQSSDAPSGLTAMPMMSGREIAEISQVLTVTIAEEFSKPKSPEGQRVKPRLDELSSLMVSQVISTELEQQLPSPEKIDEKTAAPSLLGREIAEKTEIITAASVEQIPEFKKTEGEKGRPDVEEMSFITVSEVLSTEAEQELPSQEAPKEYKALSKVSSIEVAETSEILTVSNVEEFVKSQAPEEHKEQPTKQIAEQSMLGIRVAEKSQVITSSTTKEIIESVQPEIQKIIPEQIPYESIQQIQSVPHESERSLLPDKAAPSATAEVSFRISEGLEVIQVTATEKEAKEVVKGQAKEASAQADIVDRKVALKTEILPENVVSEFVISKPEGKIAHGVKDERQGVIVTEIQHTAEIESNLPETVIPLAKLASTSIEADHLEKIVETTEASAQHHITITQHITKHDTKQQPLIESDTEVTEEYTTKFRRGSKDDETAAIQTKKTIIRKKKPRTKSDEKVVIIEEELEDKTSQLPTIPKKQFMQIEEVTETTGIEEIIPSKIEELEETTQKPIEAEPIKLEDKPKVQKKKRKRTFYCPYRILNRNKHENKITEEVTVEEKGKMPVTTITESPVEEVVEETIKPLPLLQFATPVEQEEVREQVTVTEEVVESKRPKKITRKKIIKRKGQTQQVTEEVTVEEKGKMPVTTITEGPVEEIVEETIKPLPLPHFATPVEQEEVREQVTVTEEVVEGKKPKKITKKKIIKRKGQTQQVTEEITVEEKGKMPVTTITEESVLPFSERLEPLTIDHHADTIPEKHEKLKHKKLTKPKVDEKVLEDTLKKSLYQEQGAKDEIPEEIVEEIITEETEKQKARLIEEEEEEESVKITEVDVKELPEEKKKKDIIEKEEVIETIEKPTHKISKKKRQPKTKDEQVSDVLDEVVEDIVTEKPKKEKAKTIKEEEQQTVMITKVDIHEAAIEMPKEKADTKEEIIEIIETPTTRIIKKKKPKTKDHDEQIIQEIVQKPIEETKIMEEEKIVEIIETPTKKVIKKKKAIIRDDNVPEEIIEEIVIEKPKEEQAQTIFSPSESIEVTQILAELPVTKLTDDKAKPKEAAVCDTKEEKVMLKKVLKEETSTVPVQEEVPIEITKEIMGEKPKEEHIKSAVITKEGLTVIETISSTATEEFPEKAQPRKETAVPIEETEQHIEVKEVTVKKMPKKIKAKHATEQQVKEETVEEIISKKPTKEKAEKVIITNEELETTEIVPEVATSELDKEKPREEQAVPIEETREDVKLTEVIAKKEPLKKKAVEIKDSQPDEIVEEMKVKKSKKEKAKKDIPLQEGIEITEVTTETIPEKLAVEEMPTEKKPEPTIAPVEAIEITEVTVATADDKIIEKEKAKIATVEVKEEKEKKLPRIAKEEVTEKEKPVIKEEEVVEKITPTKSEKEKPTIEEVSLDTTKPAEIIPETKDIPIEKQPEDKLKEIKTIQPSETKEDAKPKEEITTITEEKPVDEVTEKLKEKKIKKKKKKPVKKDEIEEWVEPEYERPVLEPMPEKIQWEPSKKKKEKKVLPESVQKLVPQKIERKEIKPIKLQYMEPTETIQFEDKSIYERAPKKIDEEHEKPQKLVIGKGEVKQKDEIVPEKVKLKKIPEKKPEEITEIKEKPKKEEVIEDVHQTEKEKPKETLKFDEFQPLDFDRPEIEKYIPEEREPTDKPEPEHVSKPYEKPKKKKPDQEIEHIPLIKGIPKPEEPEEEPEIKFRIPTSEKPEDEPETITLKGWKKSKPEEEGTEQFPTKEKDVIPTAPKQDTDDVTIKQKIKLKKPKKKDIKPDDVSEEIIFKKAPEEKPEIPTEGLIIKEPTLEPKKEEDETVPEEVSEKVKIKKPKKKPVKEEVAADEVTIKKPVIEERKEEVEETTEEVTLKKKPKKKPIIEEEAADVTIKKPIPIEEKETVPEEVSEKVEIKKPKKKPVKEEVAADEVTIKKPVIEERKEEVEETTEEVTLKKKPKKKPIIEEEAADVTMKKPIPIEEKETVPEEVSEKVEIKKPKKKPVKEEVAADEVTIKKPVIEERKEEVEETTEEVTLKKKPKKKPIIEEEAADVTMKKPIPIEEKETVPEEVSEKVEIKKPKKKPVKEEVAADEVTIKKPVIEERKEEVEETTEEVTLKKKPKKKPIIEEEAADVTIQKPIPIEEKETVPEEVSEKVEIKKPKKKPVKEEVAADEVTIKKPVIEERKEEVEETTEEVTLKKKPKKKPIIEEEAADVTIKKPIPIEEKETVPEEVSEKVEIKKPKKKPVKEEVAADEVTIKKPVIEERKEEVEETTEEVTLKKKPKKKPIIEEEAADVTIQKPIPIEEKETVPEEVSEKVEIKKPKKKPVKEEVAADEVTIKKPVIEERKEEVEETTEEVTLKKKPKKKPIIEEEAADVTIQKPIPIEEKETVPEEVSEKVEIKKPKKKPVKEEVAADEVTIKKPVIEERKEEVEETTEEVTLKKKPKKKPIIEEEAADVTIQKPIPIEEKETVPEEVSEKVEIKKPKKKPVKEEVAADEVTIKKPVIEERKEEVEETTEEVTLKKKPKKKPIIEEEAAEVTIKKPIPVEEKEEAVEEISEKIAIKKPKKKPIKEEAADEVTIQKPVVEERKEEVEDITEQITLKKKPKKKVETEEISEVTIATPKEKKEKEKETTETSTDVLIKKKKPVAEVKETVAEELTIQKVEEVEEPKEVIEEFTLKRKPPKKAPKPIEEIYEDVTLRKLRPKKKPRPDIKEVTEVENVTFRPRTTKTKEDVEQEFKISLNTYEEEDISMSGKVRLKPKKRPLTYSEETGEETIKIIQEVGDDSGPIIEEIIDESEEEDKAYSIEELDVDEMSIPLRRKKKKQKVPYSVEEIEEDVKVQLKRDRKYSYEETDVESLALKLKSKRRVSTYEEVEDIEYVIRDGDTMYSICSYVAETEEAINLVEGEKVYIIDHTNQDWWFVKKHLTEEKGWVPAQYLLDEVHYTVYLQRKLHEKIDKLPIFEKPAPGEKASAPRFIEKLQPIHTLDGYTVQFECQVEGIPRPQITWFRQTAIIKPSTDFQIYYDEDNVATLIIREVFPEDAGTFTCVAKNAAGFASSTTELIVEAPLSDHGSDVTGPSRKSLSRESSLADILEGIPPTFSRKPKAKYVNEGDDVILECRLVAVPEPDVTWYYKDVQVVNERNIVIATESDMHMYCSVVKISKIQKKQEGRYKIVAKNREGEATIDIPVKVKTGKSEPPEILEPLQSYVIKEGETVVLSTQIVGNPSPKITWYKDGKPIKNLQPKQDGHVNMLSLIQPQLADSGEYSVVAINDVGKAETRATLTVEKVPSGAPEPPLFTERFQELVVPEKGTFKLVAKVTGNPVPEVTWLRNNKPLEKSLNITESYDGENIMLEIRNADSETDAGDYKCVANNPVGKASHGAKVTVDVAKVSFTRKLQNEVVIDEYKTLELNCETSHTVSTVWWHNDKEISGMDHREIIQEGRVHRLLIKKSSPSDAGTYKCTVKNQVTSSNVIVRATKPEFVKKLQDFEVKEREVAILEVEITSQTADVTWRKDGELLTPSKGKLEFVKDGTIRKLLIRTASVHDEGEYTCALPDEECTAEVTVVELPPEIITKMQDVTIARGEKATFDIELTKGDALVRWFKDGQELQFSEHVRLSIDGKRQKLKIYDAEVEDAGIYSCQVGDQTSSASLTVEEPEVDFIKKLPDVTLVPLNADATFLIELSRADIPVTWLRKGEIIDCTQSPKYSIVDEGNVKKLIVKKCTTDDIAEYTAVVANVKTSSRLKVEVIEAPPKINLDTLKIYKTTKGDDIDILVKFTATPLPNDEWTVNGRALRKSKRIVASIDESSAVLTIRDVQEKDFGDYNLKLTNPLGEDSIEISVIVVQVPGAPGIPEPLEITDNSVTLHWNKPESDGHSPIIEYILEYREKTESSWSRVTKTISETTYKLTDLTTDKEYTFRVTAVNEAGPGEASPNTPYLRISKLSAFESPIVLEALKSIVIGLGETVTLSCVIGGVPAPRITWLKNDEIFEDPSITYENRVAKYTISKTTETSSATFTVRAQNDAGTAETSCQLKIQESPKITCDRSLTNQRLAVGDKWTVEIRISGFPRPEVTWTKNNKKITDNRISVETKEDISIITIPSLVRDDTAVYTVKATNEAGSSSIECRLRVIDKPSKPQGPVVAKEIRQDRVTIEWQPPADDGGVELERYIIEKCEANKDIWTKVGDVDKEVESFCAQKLQQNVDYSFRIIAKNEIGSSDPLESEPIRTRSSFEPPAPPRGPLEISGMTKTSFTIKWEPPENDGGTPITDYIIEAKETSKKTWQKITSTKGDVTNAMISDLKTDVSYNFRITAKNSVGTGLPYTAEEAITVGKRPKIKKLTENSIYALLGIFPSTKMVVVKTPPSCPLNVRATNVTSKSVTLTWSPPATTGGSELTGYIIEKRPLIGKGARWTKVVTLDATTQQYCIENLKESEFLFRIFAENSVGLSTPTNSEPVTLKTHANVPSPPTAPLEMRQIAANTMVIEWGRPESDGGAPLEGYKIAIRDARKTMWMEVGRVNADIQKLNIRDLQENHEYLVRIFARNEIGFSDHLESEEPFKIVPTSQLSFDEPIAEAMDKGETASVSFSTENTSSWLREHNMDADIHSYARARLLRKDEYFFRIWHYAKKLFE
ncbi:Titin [Ooceraea biroi]|uniref:Titin n=1 Tax=Ooceraea biroi TaxID=2015173 RepID=A0A026VUD4_OOCBI|nr:Titin [Ooceraea biroi]